MAYISEIILFYSNFSSKCKNVLYYIDQHQIPIKKINVSNPKIREIIKSYRTNIKITGVPTIIVSYTNAEAELFEGQKVMLWLDQFIKQTSTNNKVNESYNDLMGSNDNIEVLNDNVDLLGDTEILNDTVEILDENENIELLNNETPLSEMQKLVKEMELQRKKIDEAEMSNQKQMF